uniref:hypothetical protein n=1 Tax=Paractinoplanes polyasparticus TaxID=2856853 RepID=UPI001C855DF1|nr:hypothetical protein [Actinoplanes polyasparticus]
MTVTVSLVSSLVVRAVAGTGAQLFLVTSEQIELEHGIGAVLRYEDGDSATVSG